VAFGLIAGLCALNVIGVRESTTFNGIVSAIDVVSETSILFFGFFVRLQPGSADPLDDRLLADERPLAAGRPRSRSSRSSDSNRSRRRRKRRSGLPSIIPRTSIGLILTILVYALAYSNLALGMTPAHPVPLDPQGHAQTFFPVLGQHREPGLGGRGSRRQRAVLRRGRRAVRPGAGRHPALDLIELGRVRRVAHRLCDEPLAAAAVRVRTRERALSHAGRVDPFVLRRRAGGADLRGDAGRSITAPTRSTTGSSTVKPDWTYSPTCNAFGAATSYSFVFVALIALRLKDPAEPAQVPHPAQHPGAFPWRSRRLPDRRGSSASWGSSRFSSSPMLTHPIGRVAGPLWLIAGVVTYLVYRQRKGLPLVGSRPRGLVAATDHHPQGRG